MANFFDQFDEAPASTGTGAAKAQGNFFDQFDEKSLGIGDYAKDIVKQVGSKLITGLEAIPAAVPSALGLVGQGYEKLFGQGDPEAVVQRESMQGLIEGQHGGGIKQYLPEAQTEIGRSAGNIAEFIPSMVGGTSRLLSPLRAAGVGATAGGVSEAAGRVTEGTAAEPYARATAALVGGVGALRQAERAAALRATPSIDALHAKGAAGYEAAKNLGVEVRASAAEGLATRLKGSLTEAGMDENIAPKTWGILGKLEGAPDDAVMTVNNLQSLRRTLGKAAGSIDPSERLAAVQAKNAVDDFLANLPEGALIKGDAKQASGLLKEANANYAAAERAAAVDRRVVRAQLRAAAANSGMNVANTIRQRLADVLVTPALQRGYSPAELAQMKRIVQGGAMGNALRYAGNLLGGGGGLGQLATTAAAGGAAYAFNDPRILALPLAGAGARMAGNRMTLADAARLNAMLRARSPLGAAVRPPVSAGAAPFAALGPVLQQTQGLPGMQYGGRPIGPTVVGEGPGGPETFIPDAAGNLADNRVLDSMMRLHKGQQERQRDVPFAVGTRGPEVFVPDQPGTIVPTGYGEEAAARTRRRAPTRTPDPTSLYASQGGVSWERFLPSDERARAQSLDALRGENYDPRDVLLSAIGAVGAPAVGPAQGGATLGAGVIKPIRAYHGSPHDFEKFDISKIGTGEGAQAYGHGLYFAENPKTAKAYRDTLADRRMLSNEGPVHYGDVFTNLQAVAEKQGLHPDQSYQLVKQVQDKIERGAPLDDISYPVKRFDDAYKAIADEAQRRGYKPNPGRMYEVNINAAPEQFLDWEKNLRQQPEAVQQYFKGRSVSTSPIGSQQQHFDLKDPKATREMAQAGIPGIKYLDQGSRGGGQGTSNYVLFRDDIIDLVKKYGWTGLGMFGIQPEDAQAALKNPEKRP